MIWKIGLVLVAMLALGPVRATPQASQCEQAASIIVGWENTPPPKRISFDGGGDLAPCPTNFRGAVSKPGSVARSNIAVVYDNYQMQLNLLLRTAADPAQFRVYNAQYGECELDEVREIYGTETSGTTVNFRVALMMRARRLLYLTGESCPARERSKLIRAYFRTSCSLASEEKPTFVISPEARALYVTDARTPAEAREAKSCTGLAERKPIGQMLALQGEAIKRGDVAALGQVTDELLTHATDDAWQDGFDALQVDADDVRQTQIHALSDLQRQAGNAGQLDRAIQLNQALVALKQDESAAAAFRAQGLSDEVLAGSLAQYKSASREQ